MRFLGKWRSLSCVSIFLLGAITSGMTCQDSPIFHLAILPGPAAGLLLLAQEQDLFAKAGLTIELHPFASISEAQKALASGHIQLLAANLMEVMRIQNTGESSLQIQLVTAYSTGSYKLIARRDAGSSLEELKGARFGIEPNTFDEYLFLRAFSQKKLPSSDFTLLNIPSDRIVDALVASEIQATFTSGAVARLLESRDDMQVLLNSNDFPQEVLDVIAASPKALHPAPQLAEALRTLWTSALEAHRAQPQRAKQLLDHLQPLKNTPGLQDYKLVEGSEQDPYFAKNGILSQVLTRLEGNNPISQPPHGNLKQLLPANP